MAGKYDSIDRHVVSPSLLAQFGTPPPGKKPKREFLLGLGEPFEPNPWDCDSDSINDADLLMASQVAEEEIPECKPQPSTGGVLLRLLFNWRKSAKMGYQKTCKNKPTGHYPCGLSGHLGGPKTLSRAMNLNMN